MAGWYDGWAGWAVVAVAIAGSWSVVLLALVSLFRGTRPPDPREDVPHDHVS